MQAKVQKLISANDIGLTGSHQAGIHIPKTLTWFFPVLDEHTLNPDYWLTITTGYGDSHLSLYIHYNNKIVTEKGTRDEFRITRIVPALRSAGASAGSVVEFARQSMDEYTLDVVQTDNRKSEDDPIVIDISKPWKVIRR
jgi:hypothetical protein